MNKDNFTPNYVESLPDSRIDDKRGKIFGRLTVTAFAFTKGRRAHWLCHCMCGNEVVVSSQALSTGDRRSCDCLKDKHGMARKGKRVPEYAIWSAMRQRCRNPKDKCYQYYGAKGITVCNRWDNSFKNFIKDMGRRPNRKLMLDRIDNNGNYEPDNCRWASYKEQANNKTSNVRLTYNGETKTIAQWADEFEISYDYFHDKIRDKNWSIEKVLAVNVI